MEESNQDQMCAKYAELEEIKETEFTFSNQKVKLGFTNTLLDAIEYLGNGKHFDIETEIIRYNNYYG